MIPLKDLQHGIDYIRSKSSEENELTDKFWTYFSKTSPQRYSPSIWNINETKNEEMAGRTNNALERCNRRIGDFFNNAHPNLTLFINIHLTLYLYIYIIMYTI